MRSIMQRTNNIEKYCACAANLKRETSKRKFYTSWNNPQVTQKHRYAELIRSAPTYTIIATVSRPPVVQNLSPSF
jgi:hypothetical protein